jgi:hypothetical protein
MSIALTIQSPDFASTASAVDNLFGQVSLDQVKEAMGASMRLTLIEHFAKLEGDSIHHRSAARLLASPTGFYADAARGTQLPQIESDGVSVSINKEGLAQRYFGGPIVASGKSKWLTIPAIALAYGKRAGSFNNLRFVYFRQDLAALVERLSTLIKRDRKGIFRPVASTIGAVFYWLKREVTQSPDPSVLPTDDEILGPATLAGEQAILRIWERPIGT